MSTGSVVRTRLALLTTLAVFCTGSFAQEPVLGPEIMVYKTVAATNLTAHVFRPPSAPRQGVRPAIVLFHGGGWAAGSPGMGLRRGKEIRLFWSDHRRSLSIGSPTRRH